MAHNWCSGVLKPAEHEFGFEKFLQRRIGGLDVKFLKKLTLPVDIEIGYMRFLISGIRKIDEKFTRCITKGLQVDFEEYINFAR